MPGPNTRKAPLALTMGEPAGIGGEIALKAWRPGDTSVPVFFAIDDADRLAALAIQIGVDTPVETIATPGEAAAVWARALPVLSQPLPARVEPGKPGAENAAAVISAIDTAVGMARNGDVAGLVTNPIQKKVLYEAGFRAAGHTEYLAELTGATAPPVMMLAVPGLRVALVTIHLPLADAIAALTTEAIVETATSVDAALRQDFSIAAPRLAIAGLNPHAGESGSLGREEIDIISPAIDTLRRAGIDATGPFPADTMFHADARSGFDAAICMYHDQGLIPLKTIDFHSGVNITLGLSIVRTSPDHGTALDIAGSGQANPTSLLAALRAARDIADTRQARHEATASSQRA
ncbi:MAG: 4-hydroxythreonine-4-phosphate dehydrogenase PdxA [Alphaproteobacteria bacterium]|jgi:4-hydroxythreonine-4-phosphate dehydrogenase